MKRSQFMIQDYPQLVKYFASRNPVHLLLFALPLFGLFLYYALSSTQNMLLTMLYVLAGIFYWSFLEYAIHRFLYHTPFKSRFLNYFLGSFHQYHHKQMADQRVYNAGFLMVYLVTPSVLTPFLFFTQDVNFLSSMGVGLLASHYFYEWIHYILHYKVHESGYLQYIQKYHFHHHDKAPARNFGNTSHLWDVLLGTYDDKYKQYSMPQSTRETLINHVHSSR